MGAIMKNDIPYGAEGGNGGHAIINSGGSAVNERSNLKFAGYTKLSDDAVNDTTIVSNDPTPITYAEWQEMTTQEKEGTYWLITGGPTGNFLAYGNNVIGGGGGGAAEGRILTFNTLVSDSPIVIQDTNITGLTDEEKLIKATTVLFTRLPMEKPGQVFTEIEIAMKCNISENNLQGNMRFEAFYVLNGNVDKEIRPHSIQNFTVQTVDEWNILRLFYLTPELDAEDNILAIKLLCTGGTAEIGISAENLDYGDAFMLCTSEGLSVGQVIEDVRPTSLTLVGKDSYNYLDTIQFADYNVICTYADGKTYDVTNLVNFNPIMGTVVGNSDFTLTASYMGLNSDLPIVVDKIDRLEVIGPNLIHGSYTIKIEDFSVKAILQSGTEINVIEDCIFDPAIDTTIEEETTMTISYAALWTEDNPEMELFEFEMATVLETLTGGAAPNDTITYTLYNDDYIRITGYEQEYGTYQSGYTYSTIQLPAFTNLPEEYTLEFAMNHTQPYPKMSFNLPVQQVGGVIKGKIKKIINNSTYIYSDRFVNRIWNKINFKGQSLLTSDDLYNIIHLQFIMPYAQKARQPIDLSSSFEGCSSLTNLKFINTRIDLYQCTGTINLSKMFKDCTNLEDISTFKFLGQSYSLEMSINLSSMFENCDKIRNISTLHIDEIIGSVINIANMFARSYEAYQEDPIFENTHILDADQLAWTIPNTWDKTILGTKEGSGLTNQIGFLFGTDIPQSETSLGDKSYPLPQWYADLCEYTA